MTDSQNSDEHPDRELLAELAPFLAASRMPEELDSAAPEGLADRILSEGGEQGDSPLQENLPRDFGPYKLCSILGRGGGGTVYAGFDAELRREIAIKILAPELAAIPASRERFLREAQAAAQLQHDHIMPIFAVHQDTELPCLTMPLLKGDTLQARIESEGALPADEITRIAAELCQALTAAHQSRFVHRDLKPSNVFLEAGTRRCRLMDFGLVKAGDAPGLTQPGVLAGTPEYLPPEQLHDAEPDERSDLYGLGATMYAMAAGHPPFSGPLTAVLKKVAHDEPTALPNELPAALRQMIARLMEKDPAQRYQSAREVAAVLQPRCDSSPTSNGSNARIWVVALVTLIVIVGVVWKFATPNVPADPPASTTPQENAASESLSQILAELPTGSLRNTRGGDL